MSLGEEGWGGKQTTHNALSDKGNTIHAFQILHFIVHLTLLEPVMPEHRRQPNQLVAFMSAGLVDCAVHCVALWWPTAHPSFAFKLPMVSTHAQYMVFLIYPWLRRPHSLTCHSPSAASWAPQKRVGSEAGPSSLLDNFSSWEEILAENMGDSKTWAIKVFLSCCSKRGTAAHGLQSTWATFKEYLLTAGTSNKFHIFTFPEDINTFFFFFFFF